MGKVHNVHVTEFKVLKRQTARVFGREFIALDYNPRTIKCEIVIANSDCQTCLDAGRQWDGFILVMN